MGKQLQEPEGAGTSRGLCSMCRAPSLANQAASNDLEALDQILDNIIFPSGSPFGQDSIGILEA